MALQCSVFRNALLRSVLAWCCLVTVTRADTAIPTSGVWRRGLHQLGAGTEVLVETQHDTTANTQLLPAEERLQQDTTQGDGGSTTAEPISTALSFSEQDGSTMPTVDPQSDPVAVPDAIRDPEPLPTPTGSTSSQGDPAAVSTDPTTATTATYADGMDALPQEVVDRAVEVVGVQANVSRDLADASQVGTTPSLGATPSNVTLLVPPTEQDTSVSGTWEGYISLWPLHTAEQIIAPSELALRECFRMYFYPVNDTLRVYEVVNSTLGLLCTSQMPQLQQLRSNDHVFIEGTLTGEIIALSGPDSVLVVRYAESGGDISGGYVGGSVSAQQINKDGPITGGYRLMAVLVRLPNYPAPAPSQCGPGASNLTDSGVTIQALKDALVTVNGTWSECSYGKLYLDVNSLLLVEGNMTSCTNSRGQALGCNKWGYTVAIDANWMEQQRLAITNSLVAQYGEAILSYDGHLFVWPYQGRCAAGSPPASQWFGNAMFKCRYVTDGQFVPGQGGQRACVGAFNGPFGKDNFTLVHEMGHMLGLQHGRTLVPNPSPGEYPFVDYGDRTTVMGNMGFPDPGFPVVSPANANWVVAGTGHAQCYSLPQLYLLQWNTLTELNSATLPNGVPARINITTTTRAAQAGLIIRTDWLPPNGCRNMYNGVPVNCDNVFVNFLLAEGLNWQDDLRDVYAQKSNLYRYGASWADADALIQGQAGRFLYEAWWAEALADDETYFFGAEYKLAITQRAHDDASGIAQIEVCRYTTRPADCMSVTWFLTFFDQTGLQGSKASARSVWPIFTTTPGASACTQPPPSFNANPVMSGGAAKSFSLQLSCMGYKCPTANTQWSLQLRSRPVPAAYPVDQDLPAVLANLTSADMPFASCPNPAYCEYSFTDLSTLPSVQAALTSFTLCITPSGLKNTVPLYRPAASPSPSPLLQTIIVPPAPPESTLPPIQSIIVPPPPPTSDAPVQTIVVPPPTPPDSSSQPGTAAPTDPSDSVPPPNTIIVP